MNKKFIDTKDLPENLTGYRVAFDPITGKYGMVKDHRTPAERMEQMKKTTRKLILKYRAKGIYLPTCS